MSLEADLGIYADQKMHLTDEKGNVVCELDGETAAKLLGMLQQTRETFLRRSLTGFQEGDREKAAHYGVEPDAEMEVILIAPEATAISQVKEFLRQIWGEEEKDCFLEMGEKDPTLVMLHTVTPKEPDPDREGGMISEGRELAEQIVSMINTELMCKVRAAYGNRARGLRELPERYAEACSAMEICRIFYAERTVASYEELGLGRLIYELPEHACRKFLKEVQGEKGSLEMDEQELQTVNIFFEKNLNISEAARDLFMHRNTLVYHLEKLQKKTGLDIRRFSDAMLLKMALMVKMKWFPAEK